HLQTSILEPIKSTSKAETPPSEDGTPPKIKRPSIFLSELKSYLNAIHHLDSLSNTNLVQVLQALWKAEMDSERADAFATNSNQQNSKSKTLKSKLPHPIHTTQPLLYTITSFYIDLVGRKFSSAGVYYSEARRAFVSPSGGVSVVAEYYADLNEINALAELLGPQGSRYLDSKMCKLQTGLMVVVKEMISQNKDTLERLKTSWTDDLKSTELLKKMKHIRDYTFKCLALGQVHSFRRLLSSSRTPFESLASKPALDTESANLLPYLLASTLQYLPDSGLSDAQLPSVADAISLQIEASEKTGILLNEVIKVCTTFLVRLKSKDGAGADAGFVILDKLCSQMLKPPQTVLPHAALHLSLAKVSTEGSGFRKGGAAVQ
ncbi:Nck-associated protein 1, partial [Chytridiales sp. JEL 0842]